IRQLFCGVPQIPPVSSTKSYFGHTLGAAGVLEFIVSLLCLNHDVIPPTLNFDGARPGCDLDYVPNSARKGKIRYFISNSAEFGCAEIGFLESVRNGRRGARAPGRRSLRQ